MHTTYLTLLRNLSLHLGISPYFGSNSHPDTGIARPTISRKTIAKQRKPLFNALFRSETQPAEGNVTTKVIMN
jgi:hypothetical protein